MKFLGSSVLALSLLAVPAFAQDLAPMASAPSTQPSHADQHFVQSTIQGNLAEIALSKLALQRSQQVDVQSFAQRMVNDHTTANDALVQLAQKDGIHQPEAVDAMHARLAARLAGLNGSSFDRAYIGAMVHDHDAAVKAFDHEIDKGQNAEIVQWAKVTLPTIQQHDQMAHILSHTLQQRPATTS
jgi:putative membrane protein